MFRVDKIETQRLVLRRFEMGDLDEYYKWKSQTDYHKFLPSQPKTKQEYVQSLAEMIEGYDREKSPNLTWAVALKENGKVIGSVNIGKCSSVHKCCEIGWGINPDYQKKGYAYESVAALLQYVFETLDMNKVAVSVWEGNNPSRSLAEKFGFVFEGKERKCRIKDGKVFDVNHFGLLKEEYKRNK